LTVSNIAACDQREIEVQQKCEEKPTSEHYKETLKKKKTSSGIDPGSVTSSGGSSEGMDRGSAHSSGGSSEGIDWGSAHSSGGSSEGIDW
jgi:hypothetical protein